MVKVSVIMPVYNAEEYVSFAIDSILNQTFTDFEFIIINDGSTDRTRDIIKRYKDKRIKFVNNEKNLGIVETLNLGLDLAVGEYIARMDSDDISLPDRFEKQIEYLDNHPDVGVLGTSYIQFGNNVTEQKLIKKTHITYMDIVLGCPVAHPSVLVRKSILDKYNLRYRPEYKHAEDYDLWSRMIKYTHIHNLPDILLKYRCHGTNISIVKADEQNRITCEIRNNMIEFLTDIPELQLDLKRIAKLARYYDASYLSKHMMWHHPIRWLKLNKTIKKVSA